MSKLSMLICSFLVVFSVYASAEDANAPLKDKKAAKIAVLSMTSFKVLMGGDGFGGAKSLSDTAKAGDEKKKGMPRKKAMEGTSPP